jgi:predicted AlkP superfamily pyrophosphatase or phosphodiesterase
MTPRPPRLFALVLLLSLFVLVPPVLQAATGAPQARPARPTLVVLLMVDQMRADYLDRYGALLDRGLKRLTTEGAWYTNARLPYMNTVTCAGHTTAGTGTFPYQHGMINNAWVSRETESSETCTEDPATQLVAYGRWGGPGESAKRMKRPTLAELLKKDRDGRTVSLSLKARSAIGMGGHAGDAIAWFDERGYVFTTSTAFAKTPEPSIAAFIRAHPIDTLKGTDWTRSLPPARYQYDDEPDGERASLGWGMAFPHTLGTEDRNFYPRWEESPYSDEYLEQMAEAAIDGMHLGAGQGTDFLGVSFSALDLVGHAFGPRSHEIQDTLVRLDRTLGRLLDFLDQHVGRDHYILALSSDHGVGDIPEQVNGARLSTPEPIVRTIDEALRGVLPDAPPRDIHDVIRPFVVGGVYVAGVSNNDVYFRAGVLDRIRKDPKAMAAVIDALKAIPGIENVLRGEELATSAARASSDPMIRAAALSYVAGQSGDLVLILRENAIISTSAANHGTAREYDQRVPIIFYGSDVRAGRYDAPVTTADIAVTLGARAGIAIPSPDGHLLVQTPDGTR